MSTIEDRIFDDYAKVQNEAEEFRRLLVELIDIEGPQPGNVAWANKVKAALDGFYSSDLLPPLTASIAIVKERDAYRADAMRYRWLRNGANRQAAEIVAVHGDDDLDAAIDSAMAQEKQP